MNRMDGQRQLTPSRQKFTKYIINLSSNLLVQLLFAKKRTVLTRSSAIAEKPRDALRHLKYYGRFLTELLTRSSANPEEPCEHTVS